MVLKYESQNCQKKKPRRKRFGRLKAACLAAGLATAWGGEADADVTFRTSITPVKTMTDAVVFYNNGVTSNHFFYLGTLLGGQTSTFEHTLFASFEDNVFFDTSFRSPGYIIAGVYDDAGTPGVSLTLPNDVPIGNGQDWDQTFAAFSLLNPTAPVRTEAQFIDTLQNGDAQLFLESWKDYFEPSIPKRLPILVTHFGEEATIVNFSTATFGGTVTVVPVPEPSSLFLCVCSAAGIFLIARDRRRR